MTIRSVWHINNSQTREDSRFAPLGIMTPNSTSALSTANGVVPAGTSMNLTSTGAMTAQVEVGRAVVQGLLTQGCYPVVITAPEALTFAAGDASNPRIDSVMLVIRDDVYDSTGFTDVRCIIVQGTAAASPSAPALPTTASLRLFNVRVEAGVSAGSGGIDWATKVTDVRTWAVPLGGIGLGANPGAYAGQWRDSGGAAGTLSRYNGSAWEGAVRLDSAGTVVIGDTNLRRDASNVLATDDTFRVYRTATSDNALSFRVTGVDTGASRFFANTDGNLNWGPGGVTATDTNLYRAAADVLKSDSKFRSEVEVVTSGTTGLASGWTLTNFWGRRTAQVVTVDLYVLRTGADIVLSSGNLPDTTLLTLPSGWRPQHDTIPGFWDNGVACGGAVVGTDGIVTLRTSTGTISNNTNLRITFFFVQIN